MRSPRIFFITGQQGEGKTTMLIRIVDQLVQEGVPVSGFVAEGEWHEDVRKAFRMRDLGSGKSRLLCSTEWVAGSERLGRFYFVNEAVRFGNELLKRPSGGKVIVIDEVGKFELEGKVWAERFAELVSRQDCVLLISVRDQFVDEIVGKFGINDFQRYPCTANSKQVAGIVRKALQE
jgi:nucleoside-triphosphatase